MWGKPAHEVLLQYNMYAICIYMLYLCYIYLEIVQSESYLYIYVYDGIYFILQ